MLVNQIALRNSENRDKNQTDKSKKKKTASIEDMKRLVIIKYTCLKIQFIFILFMTNCIAFPFQIADFGLSNVFDEKRLLATFCGSPLYASPGKLGQLVEKIE